MPQLFSSFSELFSAFGQFLSRFPRGFHKLFSSVHQSLLSFSPTSPEIFKSITLLLSPFLELLRAFLTFPGSSTASLQAFSDLLPSYFQLLPELFPTFARAILTFFRTSFEPPLDLLPSFFPTLLHPFSSSSPTFPELSSELSHTHNFCVFVARILFSERFRASSEPIFDISYQAFLRFSKLSFDDSLPAIPEL